MPNIIPVPCINCKSNKKLVIDYDVEETLAVVSCETCNITVKSNSIRKAMIKWNRDNAVHFNEEITKIGENFFRIYCGKSNVKNSSANIDEVNCKNCLDGYNFNKALDEEYKRHEEMIRELEERDRDDWMFAED